MKLENPLDIVVKYVFLEKYPVADPGFYRGVNCLAENCMKLKEFGPLGNRQWYLPFAGIKKKLF